jgi:error-prone DNA polymerase
LPGKRARPVLRGPQRSNALGLPDDETGMLNITCSPGLFLRTKKTIRTASALLVRGTLEKADGVINLLADRLTPLSIPVKRSSRDWC